MPMQVPRGGTTGGRGDVLHLKAKEGDSAR